MIAEPVRRADGLCAVDGQPLPPLALKDPTEAHCSSECARLHWGVRWNDAGELDEPVALDAMTPEERQAALDAVAAKRATRAKRATTNERRESNRAAGQRFRDKRGPSTPEQREKAAAAQKARRDRIKAEQAARGEAAAA